MSVRSRIAEPPAPSVEVAKVFGPGTPASFRQGEEAAQMTPASPFSPGTPIGPYDGYDRTPRTRDFVTGYNIATRPRLHERVSFETLKGLIDAYDVAEICLWHRIDSIRSLKWKLLAADHYTGDVTDAVPLGVAALRKPDRKRFFKTWLASYLYDILAYDAGTLYRMRNRGGRCVGLKTVDGMTIAPLLDYWGDSPGDGAEAYVQFANGLPWNWLTRDDIIYEPFRPHNDSPYGHAPIESIILNANSDLRFQVYFLQTFTEGNLPAAFAAAPESWTPDQIEAFQAYWDAMMYGNQAGKHQIKWMPPGSKFEWSNEKEFSDGFPLYMMRKTCSAFHVVPADLGFTENVNRSSGESQADVQHRVGDLPLMEHVEAIISAFLYDDLQLPLKFEFDRGEEQVDQVAQAEADQKYMDRAVVSSSEIREMRYGLTDSRPVPRAFFTERAGPIPLNSLFALAGDIDPQTAAPAEGAQLPHQVFEEAPGVGPNPPLYGQPLAEEIYGPKAIPPHTETQSTMPVAKEGEAAPGITSETGIYGDPLIRDEEEDEEQREAEHAAAVRKELANFRSHRQRRRKAGRWSDFEFRAVERVRGHNLNDYGRLQVRKDAGEIAVAGLAVLAADTGRVLMLQRALCDDDPAGGTWEFPGGHIEGDESPFAAAAREWSEETGTLLPFNDAAMTDIAFGNGAGWTSGIYAGFVYPVPSEDCVPVRSDSQVTNPDDPDGDQAEAIAWWNPADLPGNPAVRPELAADLDAVMAALGCGHPSDGGESVCPCGTPVVYDEMNGWQHADGSVSHDDGESVSDKMGAVTKAAGPPKGDPDDWSGIWARTHERRSKLLAKHERAVLAAWNELVSALSPRVLVRQFHEDTGQVAKLADPDRPWWKNRGRDAALAWLAALQQKKGWTALTAAIEAAIADGMAEGEADSLAVAADRQGVTGFPVAAAFAAAAQALQGDQEVSQKAQDAAQAILEGTAAALSVTLADGAEKGSSEAEMAEAVTAAVTGPDVAPVKYGLADALWSAAGDGLKRLIGKLTGGTPPAPAAPTSPPPEAPEAGPAFINWVCEGGSPCVTCQDNQGGSPYAVDDVPQYLAHNHCMCALYLASDIPSYFFNAYLLN